MSNCKYCSNEVDNLKTHISQFHSAMENYAVERSASEIKKEIKKLQQFIQIASYENPMNMGVYKDKLEDLKNELASAGEATDDYEVDVDELDKTGEPIQKNPDDKRTYFKGEAFNKNWACPRCDNKNIKIKYDDDGNPNGRECPKCGLGKESYSGETTIDKCIHCGRTADNHANPNTSYRGMRGDAPATDHYYEALDDGVESFADEFEKHIPKPENKDWDEDFNDIKNKYQFKEVDKPDSFFKGRGPDWCGQCGNTLKDKGTCRRCDKVGESWDNRSFDSKLEAFEGLGFTQGDAVNLASLSWSNISEEVQNALEVEDAEKEEKRNSGVQAYDNQGETPDTEIDNLDDVDYNIIGESQTSRSKYECEYCNSGFRSNESLIVHYNDIHTVSNESILDGYDITKEELYSKEAKVDHCPVCNINFNNNDELEEHEQKTGHNIFYNKDNELQVDFYGESQKKKISLERNEYWRNIFTPFGDGTYERCGACGADIDTLNDSGTRMDDRKLKAHYDKHEAEGRFKLGESRRDEADDGSFDNALSMPYDSDGDPKYGGLTSRSSRSPADNKLKVNDKFTPNTYNADGTYNESLKEFGKPTKGIMDHPSYVGYENLDGSVSYANENWEDMELAGFDWSFTDSNEDTIRCNKCGKTFKVGAYPRRDKPMYDNIERDAQAHQWSHAPLNHIVNPDNSCKLCGQSDLTDVKRHLQSRHGITHSGESERKTCPECGADNFKNNNKCQNCLTSLTESYDGIHIYSATETVNYAGEDGDFKEEDHPRADDGKFTSGGGSATKQKGKPKTSVNLEKTKGKVLKAMGEPSRDWDREQYNKIKNLDGYPTHPSQLKNVSVKYKAPIMKSHLADTYPDSTWSVRSQYYSGGSSLHVSWKGGGAYPYGAGKVTKVYSDSGGTNSMVDYFDYDNYVHSVADDRPDRDPREPWDVVDTREQRLGHWIYQRMNEGDNWSKYTKQYGGHHIDLGTTASIAKYMLEGDGTGLDDIKFSDFADLKEDFLKKEKSEGGYKKPKETPKATTPASYTQQYMGEDPDKPKQVPINPETGEELPVSAYNPTASKYKKPKPTDTKGDAIRAYGLMKAQKDKLDKTADPAKVSTLTRDGEPWQKGGENEQEWSERVYHKKWDDMTPEEQARQTNAYKNRYEGDWQKGGENEEEDQERELSKSDDDYDEFFGEAMDIMHKKCPDCNFETSYKDNDLWQETDADEEMDRHRRSKHGVNENIATEQMKVRDLWEQINPMNLMGTMFEEMMGKKWSELPTEIQNEFKSQYGYEIEG